MRNLVWRSRISLLWVAVAVLTPLHMLLVITEPGAIDELRAGKVEGMDPTGPVTIMWVLFVVVPLVMALLTFVLPDLPSRWANGILGVVFAGLWITEIAGPTAGAILLNVSVIVASLLVAWHAWRWPAAHPTEADREHVPLG